MVPYKTGYVSSQKNKSGFSRLTWGIGFDNGGRNMSDV